MEKGLDLLRSAPAETTIAGLFNHIDGWQGGNVLAGLAVFVLGSAFWEASRRLRAENERFDPISRLTYVWQRDTLLLTYLTLLVLLIGVSGVIAWSSLENLTFWLGYVAVAAGQLTRAGSRMSHRLVQLIESAFPFRQPVVSERAEELVR